MVDSPITYGSAFKSPFSRFESGAASLFKSVRMMRAGLRVTESCNGRQVVSNNEEEVDS